ncbi:MAG: M15 family metallopeptidase [Nocardiaceae bacterium]|nr:M15 family metallopeptidase [Nocardiaceae bacterium]
MSFRTVYGNTRSENGWRMVNSDECSLVKIPGLYLVDKAPLRKGAPLIILGAWLKWYDTNVAEISSNVWGWSATNDVYDSNHLSGTAVDINAPLHPWGADASGSFTNEQQAKIRYGMKLFEGSVFWGQDWDRKDPMHFQMAWREGDARNEAFAKKLTDGYLGIYKKETTVTAPDTPTIKSLVDGKGYTKDQFIQFTDYHMWRCDKMLTAMAQKNGLPYTDEALKQVKP